MTRASRALLLPLFALALAAPAAAFPPSPPRLGLEVENLTPELRKFLEAPQDAGVIHTDFERGFIRAFTIGFDDYITYKGEVGAKEAGKGRDEGKEYVVQDGDVIHFRFNT